MQSLISLPIEGACTSASAASRNLSETSIEEFEGFVVKCASHGGLEAVSHLIRKIAVEGQVDGSGPVLEDQLV